MFRINELEIECDKPATIEIQIEPNTISQAFNDQSKLFGTIPTHLYY